MSRPPAPLLLACLLAVPTALLAGGARAQQADPGPADPGGYRTEAARSPQQVLESPYAISVVVDQELRARPAVALDEALDLVPGVFAQGGRNLAQDARISVRGYGARADFGVRGIRILVDGVPTTLPDGQSETDSIDLAFVERIDVVRSPVSSLYGGGGGGIVAIETLRPTPAPAFSARSVFGTDHLSRYATTATGTHGGTGYALGVGYTRQTGYRDHARGRQVTWLAKLERDLASGWQLRASYGGVTAPEAQDPGGLNLTEVAADRSMARAANVTRNAHEKLSQHKVSLELRRPLGTDHELRALVYGLTREFSNALPIDRRVDLDRDVFGAALVYQRRTGPVAWTLGVDADVQLDHRRNHQNIDGRRGALTLDQRETVRAIGPWARAIWALSPELELIAGLRYDRVEFVVGDRLVDAGNGDRSDRLRFRQLSPHVGLHWGRSSRLQLYANLGSAFRVPTTTELAPDDAAGGFQSDLEPESTLGLELGAKGALGGGLAWDLALFDLRLRHVAVPFDDGMGNTLWRDAGESRRRGVELGVSARLGRDLSTRVGYTYADYRYVDFDTGAPGGDLDGRREPNTPQHAASGELRWQHPSGWFAVLSVRHFSDIEVDDENLLESDGATLSDVRVGYDWRVERWLVRPFAGVRNWSRAEYDQTLRPNAFGGRHFEPAPLAELYIGVELRLR